MCQVRLTSVDYAKFILLHAAKNRHSLKDRMDLQNILFYIYGVYYAENGAPLFQEIPEYWAIGIVFPKVFQEVSMNDIESVQQDKRDLFERTKDWTIRIVEITKAMTNAGSIDVDNKINGKGSIWQRYILNNCDNEGRIVGKIWGKNVDLNLLTDYYSNQQNLYYGIGANE